MIADLEAKDVTLVAWAYGAECYLKKKPETRINIKGLKGADNRMHVAKAGALNRDPCVVTKSTGWCW